MSCEKQDKEPIEEALCERMLETLRQAGRALTVAELHPEANAAQKEYVPAGRIEGALRVLLERGLAERHGETWSPVAAGTLAMRRGALLEELARLAMSDALVPPGRAGELKRTGHSIGKLTAEQRCDAGALVRVGLLEERDGVLSCPVDTARQLVGRGAVLAVSSAIAECRGVTAGVPLVLAPEAAQQEVAEAAGARASAEERLQHAQAESDKLASKVAETHAALAVLKRDNDAMREWFRSANLPCPVGDAAKPQEAPRAEFYHPVKVTWEVRGRIALLRRALKDKLGDVDAELRVAKATHKSRKELIEKQIEGLDAQLNAMHFDARAYRHVDLVRGVAEIRCVDDPTWLLDVQPLRAEAPPVAPAPAAMPPDAVLPAGEAGHPAGPLPEPPPPAEPPLPPPPPMNIKNVQAELVRLCGGLAAGTMVPLEEARDQLARRWRVEPEGPFAKLVRLAAERAAEKGLIRFTLEKDVARVGAVAPAEPAAPEAQAQAPEVEKPRGKEKSKGERAKGAESPRAEPPARGAKKGEDGKATAPRERALQALADAPDGLRKVDLMTKANLSSAQIEELLRTGTLRPNGKPGFGARLLKG